MCYFLPRISSNSFLDFGLLSLLERSGLWSSDSAKDDDKDSYKTIEVRIDPSDEGSDSETIEKRVKQFEDGTAEEWIQWRIEFAEVERDYPLTKASSKTSMALTLLKSKARQLFQAANANRQSKNAILKKPAQNDPEKLFELVLNDVGEIFFSSRHAARRQKNYLCYHLAMTNNFTLREFVARLCQLNKYLPYFPMDHNG